MKLKDAIRSRQTMIIDGKFVEYDDVEFSPAELETELDIICPQDPDAFSSTYEEVVQVVQGLVSGHRFQVAI